MSAALFYLQLALASLGLADAPATPVPVADEATTPAPATPNGSAGRSADQAADTEIYNGF